MLAYMTYDISTVTLLGFLLIAAYTDLRRNRISNRISLSCLLAGLGMQTVFLGWDGLLAGAGGAGVGFLCLLPFYLLGGMGAGDVKLMTGAGSFLGVKVVVFSAAFSLCLAALYALVLITYRREWTPFLQRYAVTFKTKAYVMPEEGSIAAHRFPFAVAIVGGVVMALEWNAQLDFYYLASWTSYQLKAWGVML